MREFLFYLHDAAINVVVLTVMAVPLVVAYLLLTLIAAYLLPVLTSVALGILGSLPTAAVILAVGILTLAVGLATDRRLR